MLGTTELGWFAARGPEGIGAANPKPRLEPGSPTPTDHGNTAAQKFGMSLRLAPMEPLLITRLLGDRASDSPSQSSAVPGFWGFSKKEKCKERRVRGKSQ